LEQVILCAHFEPAAFEKIKAAGSFLLISAFHRPYGGR